MNHLNQTIVVNYEISNDYSPQIILRTLENNFDWRIKLIVGNKINWKFFGDKYCIGYHGLERDHSYLACPERTTLSSGIQCEKCKIRDALFSCIICDGRECRASEAVKELCGSAETSIYIVSFGGSLKVGVSSKDRLLKRWLEQGADEGIEVAIAPNAKLGRIIEKNISEKFLVSRLTRMKTKINKMLSESPPSTLRLLDDLVKQISNWTEKIYPECKDGERKVVHLRRFYNLSLQSTPFSFVPSHEFTISGKFLGMKGPLFSFENNVQYFLDFRALRGRKIQVKEQFLKSQLELTNWIFT